MFPNAHAHVALAPTLPQTNVLLAGTLAHLTLSRAIIHRVSLGLQNDQRTVDEALAIIEASRALLRRE